MADTHNSTHFSKPKDLAFDPALAAVVTQEIAKLGVHPKSVTVPSDEAHEAVRAIRSGDFVRAERIANDVYHRSSLLNWRYSPLDEFLSSIAGGGADPALLSSLNKWLEREPNSALGHLIRGKYLESAAWAVRGNEVSSKTPDRQRSEFRADMSLATADAKASTTLDPGLPSGYALLLGVVSSSANDPEMETAFRSAIKAYPGYYELYRRRLYSLTPKWGGSVDDMYKFVGKYAAGAPDESPLKFLYLHLYAYLFDAASFECQWKKREDRSSCINASLDRSVRPGLQEGVQKALTLYKRVDAFEFASAIWPVLGNMATSAARGAPRFDAFLQQVAEVMGSDTRLTGGKGHNSYVLDDITAHVWADIGNYANADSKYAEALSDVEHTSFTDETQKSEALAGVLDDMMGYADNTSQYINIIAYQSAANSVGGSHHSRAPYLTCYAYYRLKHFAEAVSECTRLIDDNDSYIQTHYWRAKAYEGLAEWDSALADFTLIADSANNWFSVAAAINMSFDLGQKSDFAGELASLNQHAYLFDENIQSPDDLADSYNNRCFAYMKVGQLQKAMDDCVASLRFGHIPDAVHKKQELLNLGIKPSVSILAAAAPLKGAIDRTASKFGWNDYQTIRAFFVLVVLALGAVLRIIAARRPVTEPSAAISGAMITRVCEFARSRDAEYKVSGDEVRIVLQGSTIRVRVAPSGELCYRVWFGYLPAAIEMALSLAVFAGLLIFSLLDRLFTNPHSALPYLAVATLAGYLLYELSRLRRALEFIVDARAQLG